MLHFIQMLFMIQTDLDLRKKKLVVRTTSGHKSTPDVNSLFAFEKPRSSETFFIVNFLSDGFKKLNCALVDRDCRGEDLFCSNENKHFEQCKSNTIQLQIIEKYLSVNQITFSNNKKRLFQAPGKGSFTAKLLTQ